MTDQTDRDRIAALFRHPPGAERLGDAAPGEIADAVLSVLPASVDRAAVLRDFLWRLEQSAGDAAAEKLLDDNPDLAALLAAAPSAVVVHRATDETPDEAAVVAAIVAALQERAGELSELAEEQMRPSLEERAQEWLEAAEMARRAAKAAVGAQQPKETRP